jgi:hypothetical protein
MAGAAFLLIERCVFCVLVLWVTIPVQLTAVVRAASASWERMWDGWDSSFKAEGKGSKVRGGSTWLVLCKEAQVLQLFLHVLCS